MICNLHIHSEYSLLRSCIRIPDLMRKAKETGHTAVCLTDTNAMYGAVRFWQEAAAAGLKPVIGCQVEEKNDDEPRTDASKAGGSRAAGSYCLLLAKNDEGFSEMNGLLTARNTNAAFDLAGEILGRIRNCFILTPSIELASRLNGGPPGVFLELPLSWPERTVEQLCSFSRVSGIEIVPTWPAYFLEPHDFEIFRLLAAIRQNRLIYSVDAWTDLHRKNHFISRKFLEERLERFPGAAERLERIVGACNAGFRFDRIELPAIPGSKAAGPDQGYRRLVSLCWRGLERRGRTADSAYKERFVRELSVIRRLGLPDYFLIVHAIVSFARQKGIFYTGRGSAANSLVCYCLRITFVDPVRYNLYFERFLHAERKGLPDIDIDFPWNKRDTVIRHIYETYTAERTALISTHISFHARSAIRETARVFGLSQQDIGFITKRIPWFFAAERLSLIASSLPEFRGVNLDDPGLSHWKKILAYAEKITGLVRHISIHPGGMVITKRQLSCFTALETAPKGWFVTQLDMYDIEKLGLMKMDILGQRSLAVITDTAAAIAPVPMAELERIAEDSAAIDLVRGGRSIGCFYIESPAMRQLLKKLKVRTFEELTAASSVIRPGVAESGMMQKYIAFHNDPASVTYLHPDLAVLLGETHGIMIYQEDVLRVSLDIGGLSASEADVLRKSMSGKGRSKTSIEKMGEKFVDGCLSRGYIRETADELWRQIKSFAGYAFCKAHSASFARLSLMVAWLKARFPAEFMSAVLSNRGGFYHPLVYIEEARNLGVAILPPSVNRAAAGFFADTPLPHERPVTAGPVKGIRVGLSFIKGLRSSSIDAIVDGRRESGYRDIPDLVRRCGLSASETDLLNSAGCLDGFGWNRRQTKLYASRFLKTGLKGKNPAAALFAPAGGPKLPALADLRIEEKMMKEIETFGFCVSANPLSLVRPDRPVVTSDRMADHAGRRSTMLGIRISAKRVPGKDGNVMEFVSFLDLHGGFETFLPSKAHSRLAPLLHRSSIFYVTGRIRDDFGAFTLNIDGLEPVRLKTDPAALEDAG